MLKEVKMGHILVTGANGFIGSHLVRYLLELKKKESGMEEIVCMVRSTGNLSNLKGLDVKLVIGDLRDPDSLVPAVKGAVYIYHLGAELYTISRKRFLDANAVGTENLMKTAAAHAKNSLKRFLLVSSQAAAGPAPDKEPITEKDEPGPPVSWYAESKQEAEKIAQKFMAEFPITIVRPSGVYGPRDPAYPPAFKAARMHIRPTLGLKRRYSNMVFAPDLVEGMVAASRHPDTVGETYFLTDPVNYSVNDIGKVFGKAVGKPFGIRLPIPFFMLRTAAIFAELFYLFIRRKPSPSRDKVRDMSQVYWLCSPKKAREHFGWETKTSLLDGAVITNNSMLEEEKRVKEMPDESRGILWLKYYVLAVLVGVLVEVSAIVGKTYKFNPWYLVFGIVLIFWGLIFGWLALVTRRFGFFIQFIPGFVLLFGGELLNNFYLHKWSFYDGAVFGITDPVLRAAVLGIGSGLLIPIINALMRMFYRLKLRIG